LLVPREVSDGQSECIYSWTAAFRVEDSVSECTLRAVVRIRLVPDTGVSTADLATAQARWKPAIETAWSGKFTLDLHHNSCSCRSCRVSVDVRFVDSGEHHVVTVHPGSGRADMLNWYVNSAAETAAHECGHMFGNADEYRDSNCPHRVITSDGSIMRAVTGSVKRRHYRRFAKWISDRTGCEYDVI
jgi:hypothetical protein